MFDIHAHLCFEAFDQDREQVVASLRSRLAGVLVSSARYDEGRRVLDLVQKHRGFLYASLGHHPVEGDRLEDTLELITAHAGQVTAIGEVGLDYHWETDPAKHEDQKQRFARFIALAERLQKPLVIHSWDAEQDCFEMIRGRQVRAAFHCFTGKRDLAMEIATAGFYISLSTNVFFSKAIKKTAASLPLDRLLLETDSPFLDPDRIRKRNTPDNVLLSAKKIAELRGITPDEVAKAAWENAKRLFRL
ncbi:MAG: TatD family hydrolase [Candidatus Aenigmarchaeota archaeon]|nr:TatD family hydrolase [Candidatus Aenigmarchaeota archaeon]